MRWKSDFIGSLVLFAASSVVSTLARADNFPDVCGAVQAAFMTATNSQDTVYPKEVRASSHPSTSSTWHFEKFTEAMVAHWQLREGELSDLASQEDKYASTNFLPHCAWKGSPKSVMDDNDPMWVEFGNPVFSSDFRLAMVSISFLIAVAVSGVMGIPAFCGRSTTIGLGSASWAGLGSKRSPDERSDIRGLPPGAAPRISLGSCGPHLLTH
jgi:hypothetical protein